MKKTISILIILILIFLTLGCTDTQNNTQSSTPNNITQPNITSPIKTPTYQDIEWENNVVAKVDPMFKMPMDNLISSINNRDYISMQGAGTDVATVASYLLEESKKYNVSLQRQTRKNECEVAWWEMKNAGNYFVSGAKKMQAGDNYGGTLDINTATNYSRSASDHLIKAESSGFPTQTTSTEKSYGVVASWSGNSIKNTETFHVSSNEWKLSWDTRPGEFGAMNFQIYIYNSDGSLKSVAANVIGESSDYSIIRGSGDYYLTINTAQPYEIKVESSN